MSVTYAVTRLEEGERRWLVTRNGEPLTTKRNRKSAEREADSLGSFLALMGHESALVETYMRENARAQRSAEDAAAVAHAAQYAIDHPESIEERARLRDEFGGML